MQDPGPGVGAFVNQVRLRCRECRTYHHLAAPEEDVQAEMVPVE